MNELSFIAYLQKHVHRDNGLVRGIGDDCAVIRYTKSKYLLFASDMIIEGVHFTKGTDPFKIGWKAAAVNLSDIAAMGGVPKYITLSVGVPGKNREKVLKGIIKGAGAVAGKYGCVIAGGDTNSSPVTVVDVAIIGEVEQKLAATRDAARLGDYMFVTGALGDGRARHLSFEPRINQARELVKKYGVRAMMDISDGLCLDLSRLCQASGVGAEVTREKVPVSKSAVSFNDAVSYGEDFELLFTAKTAAARDLMSAKSVRGVGVTCIGKVTDRSGGIVFVSAKGVKEKINPKGYIHFT